MNKQFLAVLVLSIFGFASCELYSFGKLGGADQTAAYYPEDSLYEDVLSPYCGVWYSHYAGIGRLDGYRIGRADSFNAWGRERADLLFPNAGFTTITPYVNPSISPNDYILLYDDTVYGQADDSQPRQKSWGFAFMGVVRAINVFNGDPKRGAIIIEYINGCAPAWDNDIKNGQRPFFGIYYRELEPDIVQMANAVDLAALYAGKKYYTEQPSLDAAVGLNTVENEAEFISWGIVIPQDREK
ncbi:MAG: hypothetical protein LBD18_03915 [Treponema sp.]|jgi:hypothetical protein|nr:hypothetical protein [Treponema sp.]